MSLTTNRVRRVSVVSSITAGLVLASMAPALAAVPTPNSLELPSADSWQSVPVTPNDCFLAASCATWGWQVPEQEQDALILSSGYDRGKKAANARYRAVTQNIRSSNPAEGFTSTITKAKDTYRKSGKKHKAKVFAYYLTDGDRHAEIALAKNFTYKKNGKVKKRVGIGLIYLTQVDAALPEDLTQASGSLLRKQLRKLVKAGSESKLTGDFNGF